MSSDDQWIGCVSSVLFTPAHHSCETLWRLLPPSGPIAVARGPQEYCAGPGSSPASRTVVTPFYTYKVAAVAACLLHRWALSSISVISDIGLSLISEFRYRTEEAESDIKPYSGHSSLVLQRSLAIPMARVQIYRVKYFFFFFDAGYRNEL